MGKKTNGAIPHDINNFVELIRHHAKERPESKAVDFEDPVPVPFVDKLPFVGKIVLIVVVAVVTYYSFQQFQAPDNDFEELAREMNLTGNQKEQIRQQYMAQRSNPYMRALYVAVILVGVLSLRRLMRGLVQSQSTGGIQCQGLTYKQLEYNSDGMARGLKELGVKKGDKAIMLVEPGPIFLETLVGLVKVGAIPCFVNPKLERKVFLESVKRLAPDVFIGTPMAHLLRLRHRDAFENVSVVITDGTRWMWRGSVLEDVFKPPKEGEDEPKEFECEPMDADDPVAILTTSGSTGIPKGVVFRHGTLVAQVKTVQTLWNIDPKEMDHVIVGIIPFMLYILGCGVTAIIPGKKILTEPAKANSRDIIASIHANKSKAAFLQPVVWRNMVGLAEELKIECMSQTLRLACTGGAPIPLDLHNRLDKRLHKDCKFYTPYGATEGLPIAMVESQVVLNETLTTKRSGRTNRLNYGDGVCVGKPVRGMEVKIIELHQDEEIEEWSDDLEMATVRTDHKLKFGEIVIRGPMVNREYYGLEEQTAMATIPISQGEGAGSSSSSSSEQDEGELDCSFYHRMGDVGYFDKAGNLWYCGRTKDLVTSDAQGFNKGQSLSALCIEGVFNQCEQVKRSAVVQIAPGAIAVVVELESQVAGTTLDDELKSTILGYLQQSRFQGLLDENDTDLVLSHPDFPTDIVHNSKIKRFELATWAKEQPSIKQWLKEKESTKKEE